MADPLFISLYLDENVEVLLAALIRAHGHFATTARDAGRLAFDDPSQLAYATEHGMAIVTHNRVDFEKLAVEYFEAGRTHGGIIIAHRRTPKELAQRMLELLDTVTADEMRNQLRYI